MPRCLTQRLGKEVLLRQVIRQCRHGSKRACAVGFCWSLFRCRPCCTSLPSPSSSPSSSAASLAEAAAAAFAAAFAAAAFAAAALPPAEPRLPPLVGFGLLFGCRDSTLAQLPLGTHVARIAAAPSVVITDDPHIE